jgi:uncharacterized DUF497 family protein
LADRRRAGIVAQDEAAAFSRHLQRAERRYAPLPMAYGVAIRHVLQFPVEAVIRWLLWDDFNVVHIARHQVTPAEVEQVVYLDERALAFEDDSHRPGRLIVLGVTTHVRPLFVALDAPTGMGDRYVVTARPMTVKEEQLYEEEAP